MKVLIVEDEMLLARQLQRTLNEVEPTAVVAGITHSIEETVHWLNENPAPDLLLMDIELADGQSFDIFRKTTVTAPVIFTTAYDEFAIRAFKVNSIDYLLKPVKAADLKIALEKFKTYATRQSNTEILDLLVQIKEMKPAEYRSRFLVKQGQKLVSIDTADIAYFYSENKYSFFVTHQNQKYIIDHTLDTIEKEISPRQFFRANRQFILSSQCVVGIHTWFNQKLKVEVRPATQEHVVISRDRAADFRRWLGE